MEANEIENGTLAKKKKWGDLVEGTLIKREGEREGGFIRRFERNRIEEENGSKMRRVD